MRWAAFWMRGLAALGIALPLLAAAATAALPALKAGVFEPAAMAPEFPAGLSASDNTELRLARFRGKVVLLVFGFTNCAEVCPTTLTTLAQAQRLLGAEAKNVQVLYVTVDPERDDIARLRTYLAFFDSSFVGGTGRPQALDALRRSYGVVAKKLEPRNGAPYAMSHSTSIFLIDRAGRLRGLMPYGHAAADFAHDARLLLATP